MFKLNELRPNKGSRKKRKRVGRGHGSGSGQQAGHGHKGQQSRSNGGVPYQGHEGGQNPLYKRSPKLKKFKPAYRIEYAFINVGELEQYSKAGAAIDLNSLVAAGALHTNSRYLKILGNGEIKKSVTVTAHKFSKSAKEKIEKAGGKIEEISLVKTA